MKKTSFASFRVKRWSKNPTPHVVHKSRGNGNRIAYPSIKVEERKCSTKNAHFLSFFCYSVVNFYSSINVSEKYTLLFLLCG